MKRIAVFRAALGLASTVGREEAVKGRRKIHSMSAWVGRFSRSSAIPLKTNSDEWVSSQLA
jgi:hypothetical protein